MLLAGPRRRVPAVLRLNDGFSNDSAVFDLFVRLPRSVARNNGLVSADGIRRATIMVRGAPAQQLLANLQCYLPGVPARSPHFHPHVSSILLSMLAASEVRAHAGEFATEFTSSFAEAAIRAADAVRVVCVPPLDSDLEKCLCMLGHRVVTKQGIESDSESDGDLPLNRIVDPRVWGGNLAATEEVAALLQRCSHHPMLQDQELSSTCPAWDASRALSAPRSAGPFPRRCSWTCCRTPPSSKRVGRRRPSARPRPRPRPRPRRGRAGAERPRAVELRRERRRADAAARARARARGSGGSRGRAAKKTKRRAPRQRRGRGRGRRGRGARRAGGDLGRGGRGGERRGGGIGVRGRAGPSARAAGRR